ncbi:MAG: helix-turn-helix domain-containing protein [Acidobacteria bacterium]|jgi:cytoskeletal protein RodZ|nr:helix-turn-helix domain-containing protein [Acidobacteriota bacterium]
MAGIGPSLKEAREARDISLEEIASATKIVPRYLEALESDRLDLMPAGFFVKGIIRSYAKAVGLDPDEVLGRYRAAGLLGEPEAKKRFVLKVPAPSPAAPEGPPARHAGPAAADAPEPDLAIEDAPRPRLSEAARRRLFGLAWRTLAALLLVAVLVILWSNRRPRPPEEKPATAAPAEAAAAPAQGPVPGPQVPDGTAGPDAAPASPAGATVAPAPAAAEPVPAPAPAVEEAVQGIEIEISFQAETWINVLADGVLKVEGVFPPGATARTRAEAKLLIHTGNAGGFTFLLNGRPAKPLGRSGQVLTDIKITPDNLTEFLEVREPAVPEG